MLRINCHTCGVELEHPGALMFSPPNTGVCTKLHLCGDCWRLLTSVLNEMKQITYGVRKRDAG